MNAAIYARKSTEQDVADDAKSVTRQVDNAKAFALSKGWTVDPTHIFVDDGVSGAETRKLRSRQRMIDAAARQEFAVVVMQAQDRFSRSDDGWTELKALAKHVEVWFYSEGQPFASGTFSTNTIGFLKGEFAADYRRAIAVKTHEAHQRLAERGYVTGGRTFGYDHVSVNGHKERRINPAEAKVVKDIFQRYADGAGFKQIAHALNAKKLPSPRPQRGRPQGWEPSTVRAVLKRDLYRGVIVWNKTKKRDASGGRHPGRQPKRPKAHWVQVDRPELRIVDKKLAALVDERLDARRSAYLRNAKGHLLGTPKRHGHGQVTHLLAGFIVCKCGATFEAVRGQYVCAGRRRKGEAVCASSLTFNVEAVDHVFLDALEGVLLAPDFIDRILDATFAHDHDAERAALLDERERLSREITNLTTAIAAGGDIPALAAALSERDKRLKFLDGKLARAVVLPDRDALKAALELRSADWRQVLRGPHIAQARTVLQHLLDLPIRIHNAPKPKWIASAKPEGLAIGLIQSVASPAGHSEPYSVQSVASPTGFEPVF